MGVNAYKDHKGFPFLSKGLCLECNKAVLVLKRLGKTDLNSNKGQLFQTFLVQKCSTNSLVPA